MARKQKDHEKKRKQTAAPAESAARGNVQSGAAGRTDDMRRIAREAAWNRMFGATGRNPFTQQT
jgi:hypothetical protein